MGSRQLQPTARGANPNRLTPNQRLFVEYLLADPMFNPTRAARAAGYKSPQGMANKLMKQKAVRAMIGKALQQRIDEVKLEAKDVLEHLATALFLDPAELFAENWDGDVVLKELDQIPVRIRRCITKLKVKARTDKKGNTTVETDIELMSKDSALQLAMKHLGISGVADVSVNVGGDILLALLKQAEQERSVIDTRFIESNEDRDRIIDEEEQ